MIVNSIGSYRPAVGTNIRTANTVPQSHQGYQENAPLAFGSGGSGSILKWVLTGLAALGITIGVTGCSGGGGGGTTNPPGGGGGGQTASQLFVANEQATNVNNPHVYDKRTYDDRMYGLQYKNILLSGKDEPPVYLTFEHDPAYNTTVYLRDSFYAAKVNGYDSMVLAQTAEPLIEVPEGTTPPANAFSVKMEDGTVKTFVPDGRRFNYIYDKAKDAAGKTYSRCLEWDGSKYVPSNGQQKFAPGIINELHPADGVIFNKLENVIIDGEQASIKKAGKNFLVAAKDAFERWWKYSDVKPPKIVV